MQENTPITDNSSNSEDVLGENIKLLILHKEFNKFIDGEDSQSEEEARE